MVWCRFFILYRMRAQLIFSLAAVSFLFIPSLYATHIRAGEITAELLACGQFTYRFTLTGYEDTESGIELGEGRLFFGYGDPVTVPEEAFDRRFITVGEEEIRISTYVFEHTFPGPGTYIISYQEQNRNEFILNMQESVQTEFYIETQIVIDPLFCNSTPILDSQPVDGAVIGRIFTHNPSAYDPDGDSLAYHLVTPKQARDLDVFDYTLPDVYDRTRGVNPEPVRQDGTQPVFLTLDSLTGLLTWNAPANLGEYNVAFIVEEWRKVNGEWFRLGYVTRDMQIIVEDGVNRPPVVEVPQNLCVIAGEALRLPVTASDPDGNNLVFEGFGELFNLRNQPATLSPSLTELATPTEATFDWTPQCEAIRLRPYQVNIKVTDVPSVPPPLVTYDQWNITVIGPPVENLQATQQGEDILLRWDRYSCAAQAELVQVYRRIGSYPLPDDACQTGLPPEAGYTLVSTLAPNLVSVQDDGSTKLLPGVTYCYRMVATFPDGSVSVASEEVCVTTPSAAPFLTNVDIAATDAANGQVIVRWTEPLGEAADSLPAPYSYTLLRREGSSSFVTVAEQLTTLAYGDQGLDTEGEIYHYQVVGFDAQGDVIDTSAVASSVRLTALAQAGQIQINWQASVPWNNQSFDYPYHYIFRGTSTDNTLELLDSVAVTSGGFTYTDTEVEAANGENITYCYQVLTQGRYDASLPIEAPLLNRSQRICVSPFDSIPPCPVASVMLLGDTQNCEAQLADKPCDYAAWSNAIAWQFQAEDCAPDMAGVNVYFASTDTLGLEEYQLIASQVTDSFYVDGPLPMLAGCYRVRVVDQSGNESEWSEPNCQDNCPYFALPNVFTPNEDGMNEYFEPLSEPFCPRFVQRVRITVYNRWGKAVHTYDSQTQPDQEVSLRKFWNGRTAEGRKVSPGIYYYQADVDFYELQSVPRTYKGWVQVMYEDVGTN